MMSPEQEAASRGRAALAYESLGIIRPDAVALLEVWSVVDTLRATLQEVGELIEGYEDVLDGDEVTPHYPNKAMQAMRLIRATPGVTV